MPLNLKEVNKLLNWRIKEFFELNNLKFNFQVKPYKNGDNAYYDMESWTIFIPQKINEVSTYLSMLTHEAAHLALRKKILHYIDLELFGELKWGLEKFLIDSSILAIDEAFAYFVSNELENTIPEEIKKKNIKLKGKREKFEYKDRKYLSDFIIKNISWDFLAFLKNESFVTFNTLNNLYFLKNKGVDVINRTIDLLKILKKINSPSEYISSILREPLEYDLTLRMIKKDLSVMNLLQEKLKDADPQIILDFLETATCKNKNYTDNKGKKWLRFICGTSNTFKTPPQPLNVKLKRMREKITKLWENRDTNRFNKWEKENNKKILNLAEKYQDLRAKYRKKINMKYKFGLGRFKK